MNIVRHDRECLICEALVREIGRAQRWSAIEEAWSALLHVRQMGENLRQEEENINCVAGGYQSPTTGKTEL